MAMKRAEQSAAQEVAEADASALSTMDTPESHALARASAESMALGEFGGETDGVGLRLPFMQISHAQGKLEAFRKGSIVIGTDNLIANPGEKLLITFLAARAYWKEYVSGDHYDPTHIPKTFSTRAEVLAAGGTTEWKDNIAPTYKIALATKALIRQPDSVVCGLFGVPIGDANYAPVLWNIDKSAAKSVAPVIKSDMSFSLRNRGLYSGIYELVTQNVKFDSGFSAYVPRVKLVGYHTDAEIKQILDLFSPDVASAVDIAPTDT